MKNFGKSRYLDRTLWTAVSKELRSPSKRGKKKKSISLYQFLLNPIISAGQLHTLFFSWCSITTNPSTLACSINHRMTEWLGFVGWEVRLVPTPAVGWWPPTNSGCRGPHPAQPWALIGMGHPQLSGQPVLELSGFCIRRSLAEQHISSWGPSTPPLRTCKVLSQKDFWIPLLTGTSEHWI